MSAISHFISPVPRFENDGSVSPTALHASAALSVGGWLENKGPATVYLVRLGDDDAKSDPANNGRTVLVNAAIELEAGTVLSEWGVLADGPLGACLVIGS